MIQHVGEYIPAPWFASGYDVLFVHFRSVKTCPCPPMFWQIYDIYIYLSTIDQHEIFGSLQVFCAPHEVWMSKTWNAWRRRSAPWGAEHQSNKGEVQRWYEKPADTLMIIYIYGIFGIFGMWYLGYLGHTEKHIYIWFIYIYNYIYIYIYII